jgi:hypothetical protein
VDPPKETANTITEYRFKPEYIVGKVPDCPEKYDLMSLIMIHLGSKDKNYSGVIRMLDQLLIELQKDNDTVKTILENEYHIPFRKISEEALGMCNLSSGIYDKGVNKGIEIGKAEGILSGKIDTVKNMLKEGMSLETALRFVGLDKDTYEQYVDKEN